MAHQGEAGMAEQTPKGTFECPICGRDYPHYCGDDFRWHQQYRDKFEQLVFRNMRPTLRQSPPFRTFGPLEIVKGYWLGSTGETARQEGGWLERDGERYKQEWVQTLWDFYRDAIRDVSSPQPSNNVDAIV